MMFSGTRTGQYTLRLSWSLNRNTNAVPGIKDTALFMISHPMIFTDPGFTASIPSV
jgi:hypothetical protein